MVENMAIAINVNRFYTEFPKNQARSFPQASLS
jgi:hypothetical protein